MHFTTEKKILFGIVGLTLIGLIIFLFWETKPKPGTKVVDLGRGHVAVGTPVEYNSNPPTSGAHYEEWVKAGVLDRPQQDRHLVHSLEHGYVILSYNCAYPKTSNPNASPSAELKTATEDASASAQMGPEFNSDDCKKLVSDLTSVYDSKGKRKLIIVPRPSLDSKIALTAWTHLEKFNDFDSKRIENFIDSLRDQGPERTME